VQRRTRYRFLYRDALVAGVSVTLTADSASVIRALRAAVSDDGIRVEVGRTRPRVLLAPRSREEQKTHVVTGYVVDARDGGRLPRATVVWRDTSGQRQGAVADASGRVQLRLDPAAVSESISLVASHVGYESASVTVSSGRLPSEVTFRLPPRSAPGPDVTVRTRAFPSALDTTWQGLTRPDRFSPFGEAGVLRSLQTLPSVSVTSALSGGLHVRGSPADGVHVQVDGMPIYNQSHLFGLFDAFNDDALRTVGVFADVVPARYRAPPGGTLVFRTREGDRVERGGTVELSSTALSATVDGPLWDGRGSWLLSARRSYLDAVDWLGNDELIAQGVGSDPRMGTVPDDAPLRSGEGQPSATFYDVHGSVQHEWPSGRRVTLSTYAGGDVTEAPLRPLGQVISFGDDESVPDPAFPTAGTRWGNEAASLQLEGPLRTSLFTNTTLSVSRYHAQFRQGSVFPAVDAPGEGGGGPGDLEVQNDLLDVTLQQRLTGSLDRGAWTLGGMSRLVDVRYRTTTAVVERRFDQRQRAVQADLFGQYDRTVLDGRADVHLGLRLHGFSTGPHGRVSPRIWVEATPASPVSITAGYTRNHQFLHRLSATGDTRVDTWVTSTEDQPPAGSDHGTLGVEVRLTPRWRLHLDGYYKTQRHVRFGGPILPDVPAPPQVRPWALGQVRARGLEVLHRLDGDGWWWTASYAFTRADWRYGEDPAEQWRPAFWDRRHQGATRLRIAPSERWSGHLTWLAASGRPNVLVDAVPDEPSRLAPYHRLDVALQYERRVAGVTLTARAAVFNAYDRDNPRYRRLVPVGDQPVPPEQPQLGFTGVDVYDLGVRPSFRLTAAW
jgi:hypothetical protein